jgi:putative flippase GtrA
MDLLAVCRREGTIIRGHVAVSLAGFGVDAVLLYTSMGSGLSAPAARLISLFWAMQATFVLNRFLVFRRIALGALPRQWAGYMATNAIGNFANYLVFVGLVASRIPVASERYIALCIGAALAWGVNYCGARLVAFRGPRAARLPCQRARRT